jgi:hypothetical protein
VEIAIECDELFLFNWQRFAAFQRFPFAERSLENPKNHSQALCREFSAGLRGAGLWQSASRKSNDRVADDRLFHFSRRPLEKTPQLAVRSKHFPEFAQQLFVSGVRFAPVRHGRHDLLRRRVLRVEY